MAKPVGVVGQRGHVGVDVDAVPPAAPLQTVLGAVAEDVGQFGWPAAALLHRLAGQAVEDAALAAEHTGHVVALLARTVPGGCCGQVVAHAVRLVGVRQVLVGLLCHVELVEEAGVDEVAALSNGGHLILVVHQYLPHHLVVECGVVANAKVDHHAEDFVRVKGLLGDFQVQRVARSARSMNDGRLTQS